MKVTVDTPGTIVLRLELTPAQLRDLESALELVVTDERRGQAPSGAEWQALSDLYYGLPDLRPDGTPAAPVRF